MSKPVLNSKLFDRIREAVVNARNQLRQSINIVMVKTYWDIGYMIVDEEQAGDSRAAYGQQQLKNLSLRLTAELGKGFSVSNLKNMRQFYQSFPNRHAVRSELSWTHYRSLMRIENVQAREWYAKSV
jgi:hypothetical protein